MQWYLVAIQLGYMDTAGIEILPINKVLSTVEYNSECNNFKFNCGSPNKKSPCIRKMKLK